MEGNLVTGLGTIAAFYATMWFAGKAFASRPARALGGAGWLLLLPIRLMLSCCTRSR